MSIRSKNAFMDKSYSRTNAKSLDENRFNSSLSNNKKLISNNINVVKNKNNDNDMNNNNMNNTINMNKTKNNKEDLRIQLKCTSLQCKQQQNFLFSHNISYLYNNTKNPIPHNHRKLKHHTIHEYDDQDMPKFNPQHKQSLFQIFFMSEHDKKFKNKFIIHEEQKQKEEIKKYQQERIKERQKQKEKENNKVRNRKMLKGKRNHEEQNNKDKVMINCGDITINNNNTNNNTNNNANNNTNNNNNNNNNTKQLPNILIKTRNQQKKDLLGSYLLQLSRHPFPDIKNNYCFPCKSTYLHYNKHIQQQNHKHNIRQSLGEQFLIQQLEIIDNDKMEVLKSKEYKELEKLAECLEMVVGWVEEECGRIKKRIGERK